MVVVVEHLLLVITKVGVSEMIRCGNQIRLHQSDIDWFYKVTGSIPSCIRTVDDLNSFVDSHLPIFSECSPESEFLKMLLADRKISQEK